jgi:hypothetical protein
MVERPSAPYRSANAGEISPDAAGRIDIKQYYSAGLRFKGIEPVPVSGWQLMAGSFDGGPVRGRVSEIAETGAVATPGPHTGTQTIWQATVTGRVIGIRCDALDASAGVHDVKAEALVGASWKQIDVALAVDTTARKITFTLAPGLSFKATQVRLRGVMASSASITTGTVRVLQEEDVFDNPRYHSLRYDDGTRYFLSLQVGMLDVYQNGVYVASVHLPQITATLLPKVNFYAEFATIGIFHRSMPTIRVQRSETQKCRRLILVRPMPKPMMCGMWW